MPFWQAQESLLIHQWILRGVVTYLWLLLISKLMGQRELAHLTLFDFLIVFTVGGAAVGPLSHANTGLVGALTSVATLGALNIAVAYLGLRHSKLRRVVQDEPIILIQNGKILPNMMRKVRVNLDGLLMELRQANVMNIHDVEFAILESSGKISVIPKSQARPVTPRDMGIATDYEGMPTVIIEDGNVLEDNLRKKSLSKKWLDDQLRAQGLSNPDQVFAAVLNSAGELYISKADQEYEHSTQS